MNRSQKFVVVLALVAVVLAGLYPPWLRIDKRGIKRASEYAILFKSPEKPTDALLANAPVIYRVDFLRLAEGWGCMVGLAGLLTALLRERVPAGQLVGVQRTSGNVRSIAPRGTASSIPVETKTRDS